MEKLFSKEDIEKFGFIYEPDETKCKSLKLKLSVPNIIDKDYKSKIVEQIPYQYVNEVKETTNPYKDNPNFLSDPRIIVVGHTLK